MGNKGRADHDVQRAAAVKQDVKEGFSPPEFLLRKSRPDPCSARWRGNRVSGCAASCSRRTFVPQDRRHKLPGRAELALFSWFANLKTLVDPALGRADDASEA